MSAINKDSRVPPSPASAKLDTAPVDPHRAAQLAADLSGQMPAAPAGSAPVGNPIPILAAPQTNGASPAQASIPTLGEEVTALSPVSDYDQVVELLKQGDIAAAQELIVGQSVALDARAADDNSTLLHQAIKYHSSEMTEWLLQRGAAINAVNNYHQPPLHIAIMENQPVLVALLLKRGADPMIFDNDGFAALDQAFDLKKPECQSIVAAHMAEFCRLEPRLHVKYELMSALKSLGILLGHPGTVHIDGRDIRMPNGVVHTTEASYIRALESFMLRSDLGASDLSVLGKVREHLRYIHHFTYALNDEFSRERSRYQREHIATHNTTILYTGWRGHAIYGIIFREHPSLGARNLFVNINKGGGSSAHTQYGELLPWPAPRRLDGAFVLDLGELTDSNMSQFFAEYDALAQSRGPAAAPTIYKTWPQRYSRVTDVPRLIAPVKAQTTGNCPGASIKTLARVLCQVEAEELEHGVALAAKLNSYVKIDQWVETLCRAEAYERAYPDQPPVFAEIVQAFMPKLHTRLHGKSDAAAVMFASEAMQRVTEFAPRTAAVLQQNLQK